MVPAVALIELDKVTAQQQRKMKRLPEHTIPCSVSTIQMILTWVFFLQPDGVGFDRKPGIAKRSLARCKGPTKTLIVGLILLLEFVYPNILCQHLQALLILRHSSLRQKEGAHKVASFQVNKRTNEFVALNEVKERVVDWACPCGTPRSPHDLRRKKRIKIRYLVVATEMVLQHSLKWFVFGQIIEAQEVFVVDQPELGVDLVDYFLHILLPHFAWGQDILLQHTINKGNQELQTRLLGR
mmetsp:Transcript_28746/g.67475  ORF Transcript_28746/g.67475 Transcript_28746/m.67475 type:complete len:240 (+) Transcript_28746:67-786(+)